MSDKTFSQVLNFTRGTTGTYYDSAGVLQTAAIDEPRFTHGPVTLESLGLLIEDQRTNLFQWSDDLSQGYYNKNGNTTVSLVSGAAPDGGDVYKVIGATGSAGSDSLGTDNFRFFETLNATGIHTLSFFVWSDTATNLVVRRRATGTGTLDVSDAVALTPGANRIEFTDNYDDVSARFILGNADGDFFFWRNQLEAGSKASSPIKTEGSQVTRSADNCSRTLGSEYNNSDFTVYCDFDWDGQGSGSRYLWAISQGANNSQTRLALRVNVNSQRVEAIVSVGGTITLVTPVPEFIAQIGSNTAALSLSSSGDIVIAVNGQTETLSDPGTFGSANLLTVGSLPGGQSVWNGPVPLIKMEPRANTEEFLAEATA